MTTFELLAIILVLTALFNFINQRYLRLPSSIGLLLISILFSAMIIGSRTLGITGLDSFDQYLTQHINFTDIVLTGMLGTLLFAGALQVDINALKKHKQGIITLATISTLISTAVVGGVMYLVLPLIGVSMPLIYCFLFGALISPTDPVAVLSILRVVKVPKNLNITITGESLLNDGVGVTLFLLLLEVALGGHATVVGVSVAVVLGVCGAIVLGLGLGWLTIVLLRQIHDYSTEILLTVALAVGGYALATGLAISGPIAMVIAGLLIGNHGKKFAMSRSTRRHLDEFWELVEVILNAMLFVLIGLELPGIEITPQTLIVGLIAIVVVLLARFISVALPVGIAKHILRRRYNKGIVAIMTWGGLRGGIPIALAFMVPRGEEYSYILTATYMVVAFSIVVQGLSMKRLLRHLGYKEKPPRVSS